MQNTETLNCLLVQTQLFWADAQANRNQLEEIARSQGSDCDLIVFPETFTSGFLGDAKAPPETMDGETWVDEGTGQRTRLRDLWQRRNFNRSGQGQPFSLG